MTSLLLWGAFLFLSGNAWAQEAGLIINEVSNGPSGSQEWVELLVVGDPANPTAPVNLEGWIFDDNNGDFEGGGSGKGIAHGYLTLGSTFTSVAPGSLIVIYNDSSGERDSAIPPDDPSDGNGDGVYILPADHASLGSCSTIPTTSDPSYVPCTIGVGSWSRVTLRNGGDAAQVRKPDGTFFHGFSYGDVTAPYPTFPGGGESFNLGAGGTGSTFAFGCGDWEQDFNFSAPNVASRTPGVANSAGNTQFISNVSAGTLNYTNLYDAANCTDDADGDGIANALDTCHGYDDTVDFDADGIPDGCDLDDDNDGITDVLECAILGAPSPQPEAINWRYGGYGIYTIGNNTNALGYQESGFQEAAHDLGLNLTTLNGSSDFTFTGATGPGSATSSVGSFSNGTMTFATSYTTNNNAEFRTTTSGNFISGDSGHGVYVFPEQGGTAGDFYTVTIDFTNPVTAFSFDFVDSFDTVINNDPVLRYAVYADGVLLAYIQGPVADVGDDGIGNLILYNGLDIAQGAITVGQNIESTIGFVTEAPIGQVTIRHEIVSGSILGTARDPHGLDTFSYSTDLPCTFSKNTDSDNDGCPDALEGAASYSQIGYGNLDNSNQITGGVDADGIPLTASGGQDLGTAQDPLVQAAECSPCDPNNPNYGDADGDGVADACDLDDDNDGILDAIENTCENFFEDFGTGTYPGSELPPGQTTYNYRGDIPPYATWPNALTDGDYTLAVEAHQPNGNFQSGITDHTGGGYMMVVNADVATGDFYNRDVSLFANTDYEFSAWAVNINSAANEANCNSGPNPPYVLPNLKYEIRDLDAGGAVIASYIAGDIVRDNQWHNYTFTFNSGTATNVQVAVINNGPGGCGNDLAIDDIALNMTSGIGGVGLPCDLDADGVVDSLDTDSDNDGCPDALEGAAPNSQIGYGDLDANNQITGSVDADGIPLAASGGQDMGSAQDPLVQAPECSPCDPNNPNYADMDGDGVANACDLDNDNDGILDAVESQSCIDDDYMAWTMNTPSGNTQLDYVQNPEITDWLVASATNIALGSGVTGNIPNRQLELTGLAATNLAEAMATNAYVETTFTVATGLINPVIERIGLGWYFSATGDVGDSYDVTLMISDDGFSTSKTYLKDVTVSYPSSGTSAFYNLTFTGQEIPLEEGKTYTLRTYVYNQQDDGNLDFSVWDDFTVRLSACQAVDTDGDSSYDHLDNDSDGDGCPDALEGAAPYSQIGYGNLDGNTQITGGVDADGIPLTASGGQDLGSAQDSLVQAAECSPCDPNNPEYADNDGDSIGDYCDYDDDNDGIWDVVECGGIMELNSSTLSSGTAGDVSGFTTSFTPGAGANRMVLLVLGSEYTPTDTGLSENATVTLGGVPMQQLGIEYGTQRYAGDDNNYLAIYVLREDDLAAVASADLVVSAVGVDQAFAGYITTLDGVAGTEALNITFFDIDPDDQPVSYNAPSVDTAYDELVLLFANSGSEGSTYTFDQGSEIVETGASGSSLGGARYEPTAVGAVTLSGSISQTRRSSGVLLELKAAVGASCQDTDGDGVVNAKDTDSDGDGCNDADEAYGDPSTDTDDNGMFGSGTPTVASDGTVAMAAYSIPMDADNNGVYDFLEVGAVPSISTQPVDITLCPGCSGSISAITTNADTYQWQLFDGTTWVDLTDAGIHSGTTTSNLTITDASTNDNGNQYRVVVSNSTYICSSEMSNTALLTAQAATVITNRRITHRVNKN